MIYESVYSYMSLHNNFFFRVLLAELKEKHEKEEKNYKEQIFRLNVQLKNGHKAFEDFKTQKNAEIIHYKTSNSSDSSTSDIEEFKRQIKELNDDKTELIKSVHGLKTQNEGLNQSAEEAKNAIETLTNVIIFIYLNILWEFAVFIRCNYSNYI